MSSYDMSHRVTLCHKSCHTLWDYAGLCQFMSSVVRFCLDTKSKFHTVRLVNLRAVECGKLAFVETFVINCTIEYVVLGEGSQISTN